MLQWIAKKAQETISDFQPHPASALRAQRWIQITCLFSRSRDCWECTRTGHICEGMKGQSWHFRLKISQGEGVISVSLSVDSVWPTECLFHFLHVFQIPQICSILQVYKKHVFCFWTPGQFWRNSDIPSLQMLPDLLNIPDVCLYFRFPTTGIFQQGFISEDPLFADWDWLTTVIKSSEPSKSICVVCFLFTSRHFLWFLHRSTFSTSFLNVPTFDNQT